MAPPDFGLLVDFILKVGAAVLREDERQHERHCELLMLRREEWLDRSRGGKSEGAYVELQACVKEGLRNMKG